MKKSRLRKINKVQSDRLKPTLDIEYLEGIYNRNLMNFHSQNKNCIICGSNENISEFKERHVCIGCIELMKSTY